MANTLNRPIKTSTDVAPTGVRLPPDLRDRLLKEAATNSRSLSQEITQRLKASFGPVDGPMLHFTVNDYNAATRTLPNFGESHRLLLSLFEAMPPDKQLALLTLLKQS